MQTIQISTAQNVHIEYELSGLRDRFFALFIDLATVSISYYLLVIILLNALAYAINDGSNYITLVIFFFLPIVFFIGYQFFSEVIWDGQSLGKKAVGIKVIRIDGREPSMGDFLLRAVFHMADTILCIGVVGALLISSTMKRQRIGDMAANTTVIRTKGSLNFRLHDILKISTLENYTPTFTNVTQLTEADMLIIKRVIARYGKYPNEAHSKAVTKLVVKVKDLLQIEDMGMDRISFLKTLIKDYIVLTR